MLSSPKTKVRGFSLCFCHAAMKFETIALFAKSFEILPRMVLLSAKHQSLIHYLNSTDGCILFHLVKNKLNISG